MVRSCGWGHPRPRCTYRGLGQSPSGNSSLFPTLYSLRSTRGLGQSPSGNYSLHTLRTIGQGDGTVSHPFLSVLMSCPGD